MSDNTERKRPNANYKLSKENIREDELTFHYNREHRLAKAPQSVRDLYKDEGRKRMGLFRSLTDSKPKVMMLISIVVACLAIGVFSSLGLIGSTYNLDGNELSIQAINYEGTVIVAIKKTSGKNIVSRFIPPYTGEVNIAVSPAAIISSGQPLMPEHIFYHKIFFTLESPENYTFAVPFDPEELSFVIQTEKKTLKATVKPE